MPKCYEASETLYHLLGGKEAGLTPMQIRHEGVSHWYLRWEVGSDTFYIDPTSSQFTYQVPYRRGTGRGFLTKEPSKAAQAILELVPNKTKQES